MDAYTFSAVCVTAVAIVALAVVVAIMNWKPRIIKTPNAEINFESPDAVSQPTEYRESEPIGYNDLDGPASENDH